MQLFKIIMHKLIALSKNEEIDLKNERLILVGHNLF